MKNELFKKWEDVGEKTKKAVLIALVASGMIGVVAEIRHQNDARLDTLCGDDRSGCNWVDGPVNCWPGGSVCVNHGEWVPKEPIRK